MRELLLGLGLQEVTGVGSSLGAAILWCYWELFGGGVDEPLARMVRLGGEGMTQGMGSASCVASWVQGASATQALPACSLWFMIERGLAAVRPITPTHPSDPPWVPAGLCGSGTAPEPGT